jgi:tetratricopeptide (TPR) repeat protein/tRNA A-37 threonylcarbamoyl transferase component Bud32
MDLSQQLRRARQIFESALDLESKAGRDACIRQQCGEDAALLRQVQALIDAHEAGESFLPGQPTSGPGSAGLTVQPGARIGRYRLLEKLGEGGCGVVYMAEQEEPVHRRVALKIIKLGMDTRSVTARFEAERQALALMDHANIAKVLDAGATETGRPYFVMELVGGVKITDYCEQNHLDTRQRLDLFMQVCRAIQHAHQKGIIHRDIKPSNVLVATQDGVAIPKVIDFGIAKATQGKLTDQTAFTAFEQFLGTPAYMSPEQAQLGSLDVDTRSDIYSLGVLLYELLTGKTPFDAKELLAVGLEAMRRTICEKEPPTPSTRLKLDLAAQQAQGPSGPKTKNQNSKIANDLDWIVMKCLEKDRARRYETANGLAMDIERHLGDEPVVAGPPGAFYRLGKFVRRNRTGVAVVAGVTLALLVGVAASLWEARQQSLLHQKAQTAQINESRERQKALAEAAKSKLVADFLKDMLRTAGPSIALGRDTTLLREILDKTAARVGKDLTNQPEVEIELRDVLAATYHDLQLYPQAEQMDRETLQLSRTRLGPENLHVAQSLLGLGHDLQELGRRTEADSYLNESLTLFRKLEGDESFDVTQVLNALGASLADQERFAEAEALYREALRIHQKLSKEMNPDSAWTLENIAGVTASQGRLAEAETLHRIALTSQRAILGKEHPEIARTLSNLGFNFLEQNELSEAETSFEESLQMQRKFRGTESPALAKTLVGMAAVRQGQGRMEEAEMMNREALAMQRKLLKAEDPSIVNTIYNLASVLQEKGRFSEAEPLLREALAIQRSLPGNAKARLPSMLLRLALILQQQNQSKEAEDLDREALSLLEGLSFQATPAFPVAMVNLAILLNQQGRFEDVESLYQEHLDSVRRRSPPDDPGFASVLAVLTSTLLTEKKFAEAEPVARECLAIREKKLPDAWRTFSAQSMLGSILLGQKKYAEAETLLLASYDGMKGRGSNDRSVAKATAQDSLRRTLQNLVQLYEATGRSDKANDWRQQLAEFERSESSSLPSTKE